tara:strand:+ start:5415 stop:5993 length:579 start_codon:yes stop_codon:yes gene_type:complete
MKQTFSPQWKNSTQRRKQRKYRLKAPLHVQQKFMHSALSKILREKHDLRRIQVKVGDKVRIVRGGFSKKEGKVERIDLKRQRVFITGVERAKKDGSKQLIPFDPSNLIIIELTLDQKRKVKLGVKKEESEKKVSKSSEKKESLKADTKKVEESKESKKEEKVAPDKTEVKEEEEVKAAENKEVEEKPEEKKE